MTVPHHEHPEYRSTAGNTVFILIAVVFLWFAFFGGERRVARQINHVIDARVARYEQYEKGSKP